MISSHSRSRAGGVIVFCALSMLVLMTLAGLVLDGGNMFLMRQRLQAAVDAGALGAAQLLPATANITARATLLINLNSPGGTDLTVTTRNNFGGDPDRVEVVARVMYQPMLLSVIGLKALPISARAVGRNYIPPSTFDPFNFAGVYGENSVDFSGGGMVDSYDSTLGAYNALLPNGTRNVTQNATVVSDGAMNITGNGFIGGSISTLMPVTLGGNADVKTITAGGNVTINGSNATVTGKVITNGTFTGNRNQVGGTITENANVTIQSHTLPQIDTTTVATTNDNSSIPSGMSPTGSPPSITISGGNHTLPGGTYYLNSLTLSGTGSLTFSGTTKLYITGSYSMGGNFEIKNATNNKVGLFYTGSSDLVFNAKNGATFSSGVYAPNANIRLAGQGQFAGVYVAKQVNVAGGSAFHVDSGLSMPIAVNDETSIVFALSE